MKHLWIIAVFVALGLVSPSAHASKRIYVGNLPAHATSASLKAQFGKVGKVVKATVVKDRGGRSRGFGFITYESDEVAARAVKRMNGKVLKGKAIKGKVLKGKVLKGKAIKGKAIKGKAIKGRVIKVSMPTAKQLRRAFRSVKLFVGGLSVTTGEADVRAAIRGFGSFSRVKIAVDKDGRSRGFGFVTFADPQAAAAAKKALNGRTIKGKKIKVATATRAQLRSAFVPLKIFVGGLSRGTTGTALKKAFANYGEVVSVTVAVGRGGASKGFGFVTFADPSDARAAVGDMNGAKLQGKQLSVTEKIPAK